MAIIDKPSDYFNTKLYTGTGASQSITGVGFQPDWTWIKDRDNTRNHQIYDVIRGAGYVIYSNLTSAEGDDINRLSSFDSDGFSLGSSPDVNDSSQNFASWNWLGANGTASNTDGSITSSVSANQDAGFSIVSYTGTGSAATIGHGLSSVPKMVIVKDRDNGTYAWHVYHVGVGATKTIYLNLTNSPDTNSIYWNNTAPTSSVFSVGTSVTTNNSGDNFIAYCFADTSMSKMGIYTANGSADGTFVYLGFKPAFVMVKRTDSTGSWFMYDAKRNTYNVLDNYLLADTDGAEATAEVFDFTSQGFKLRYAGGQVNTSGASMIYMAFAENPFVSSSGVPATAR